MGLSLNVQIFRGGQMVGQQVFDSDANRTIKIGRLSSAQIKLEDAKVSRIHAVIEFAGNDMSIIDMGSTEGTAVNGAKVHKAKLNSGDQIVICDTTLVVSAGAAAMPAQMAQPAMGAPMGQPGAPGRPGGYPPSRGPQPGGMPMPGMRPGMQPGMQGASYGAPPGMMPQQAQQFQGAMQQGHQPRFDPSAASDGAPVKRISNQRLRAAAVESKPHPALPPEQQMTVDNRILEMRLYWGEVLLSINHYNKPKKITIGETRRTNVFISSEGLPIEEFPLVRFIENDYILTFCNHMDGEVEVNGQLTPLQSLRGSSAARKDDAMSESYQVRMSPDSRAIVHWGGATFAMRFVAPAQLPPSSFWKQIDLTYINTVVMTSFFTLALVVTLMVFPYDTESLREDLFEKPDRFANLILVEQKNPDANKNLLEKLKKQVEEKKEEIKKDKEPPKEKVPESKQIMKVTTKIPPQVKPQKTAEQRNAEVRQKFSKLFTGSGGAAGSILGGGGGGSLSGTLSNVIGTMGASGSASAGMAGLGIRGSGPMTGGGVGTSRGIAGIGTSGRLGGGGMGYGSNIGLGMRKDHNMTDIGTPVIMGALPMEVIKKVIDENKLQIRYCYEVQLQRQQNLEGKISMKWVIGATGSVADVKVKDTTMNNAAVENCIKEKIRTWRFPAPAGGGIVEVNYPFIFKAS